MKNVENEFEWEKVENYNIVDGLNLTRSPNVSYSGFYCVLSKNKLEKGINFYQFEILELVENTTRYNWSLGFGIARSTVPRNNYLSSSKDGFGFFCGNQAISSHKANASGVSTEKYGKNMQKGDIIGIKCEINDSKAILSFTQNGIDLGIAFDDISIDKPLFIAVNTEGNCVSIKYIVQFWNEKNHKYFSKRIKDNILIFMLYLKRLRDLKSKIQIPKRVANYLMEMIENTSN